MGSAEPVVGSVCGLHLGVNPALTITALSEHVMAGIPDNPDGERKPTPRPSGTA
jgi:hypothetical protein